MTDAALLALLDECERAVRAWGQQADSIDRGRADGYLDTLASLRAAIDAGDLGRAASALHHAREGMAPFGAGVPDGGHAFWRFEEALRQARLQDRPDAGFGH